MDPFSTWLEAMRISTAMRDMTWLWPACESIHFIGLALLIGGAGYFDLRLLGFMRRVPMAAAKAFMPWAIGGFAMNMATGTLFFIILAGLNAMFFETTLGTRVLLLGPNEDTPTSFKIVGAVSLFAWFAVLFFGRMLPYIGTGN